MFTSTRGSPASPFQAKVEAYLENEGPTVSARLREPLQTKISVLTELKDDPEFASLPSGLQEKVNERLQELNDYRSYKDRLQQSRAPEQARSDGELDAIKARLDHELALPAPYAAEWGQTDAALLRAQRLDDIKAMRRAVDVALEWYRDLQQRGDALWSWDIPDLTPAGTGLINWVDWVGRTNRLLRDAESPPFQPADRLSDARNVTYSAVLRFTRVEEARNDWITRKQQLSGLTNLIAALGLAGAESRTPALLYIPDEGLTVEQASRRHQELAKSYPGYAAWPEKLTQWEKQGPPLLVIMLLRDIAEANYRRLLPAGQSLILAKLEQLCPDGRETPARWRTLRDWLAGTQDLTGWRELAAFLAKLHDPRGEDPVAALLNFLRQDRFDLDLQTLTLVVPDDAKLRPTGKITVYHRAGDERITLTFGQQGEGERDPKKALTRYTFVPEGRATLTYRPGDTLWAELPVNADAQKNDRYLLWSGARSATFQLERLSRPPRLQRRDQADKDGPVVKSVQLIVAPEGGLPRVPDLMPVVVLKKR
jgi:hypothetical protein